VRSGEHTLFLLLEFWVDFMSKLRKFAIVLGIGSGLWIAMPFFTPFNTGNPFFDLGAQLFQVGQAWAIFGVIALASKVKNRRKNKQVKKLA